MIRFWIETHGDGRKISVNSVNFPQGEPFATIPSRYGKPLAFKGDLIHWKFNPASRVEP
jgi:hypothetical protein